MATSNRRNVGSADRVLRAGLGVLALALVYFGPHSSWGFVGILLLVTAAIGFCPLYSIFGLSTRRKIGA
jgi:hypothetical protein